MQRFITIALAFSCFFLTLTSLPRLIAQEESCLDRTIPVTPIDAHGIPLRDLQASSLRGKVHGRPVAVISTTLNTLPRRLMVCVDMSGSMWGPEGVWPVTQMMLEDIAQAGPAVGQIGMELFAEKVFEVVNISPDPLAMRKKVASLHGHNVEERVPKRERRTALWDAIWQATEQFAPPMPGDVIYALTDAGDNCSRHTVKQLEDKLLARGIRVFGFVPTNPSLTRGRISEETLGQGAMRDIVLTTGGNLIPLCADPEDPLCLGLTYRFDDWTKDKRRSLLLYSAYQLYQQMSVYYDAGIRLPFALKKRSDWDLVIADDRGRKRNDVELLYPRRLPPCDKVTPMAPSAPD